MQLFEPGTDEYDHGTDPHNPVTQQRPAFVATPSDAAETGEVVAEAARRGLRVVPQSTGHGAGAVIGDDVVIVDTSRLTDLTIDAGARTATAGAGLTWGSINTEAEKHGLLGLAGSSPSVSICGYTFGGGLGWLTRPHGMASSALLEVEYVDGAGRVRVAAEDADDPVDRDALWTFRGGGGVGIATRLTFDLVPVPDLHAGYLLWPIDAFDDVVAAWSRAIAEVGDDTAVSISVLHAPPAPPFPEPLQGKPIVHLAVAASAGEEGARPLLDAVRSAAEPQVDTWGPSDAEKLGGIHLDPPPGTAAVGVGRWCDEETPANAHDIFSVALTDDSPLAMVEIRSVGNDSTPRDGAATAVAGPYVAHAVAPLLDPVARPAADDALGRARAAMEPVDLGLSMGTWVEGVASVPDALPSDVRDRVAAIAGAVDQDGVIARSRFVS